MPDNTVEEVVIALGVMSATVAAEVHAVTQRSGLALLADVKRRAARSRTLPSASGEPPRLQTGDYNRSINKRDISQGTKTGVSIGTNKAQGRRLEFGMDEPGKHTLPHPHFGPSLDQAAPVFIAGIEAALAAGKAR